MIEKLDPGEVEHQAKYLGSEFSEVVRLQALKMSAVSVGLGVMAIVAFHYGNWPLGLLALVVVVVAFVGMTKTSRRRQMGVSLPAVLLDLGLEQTSDGLDSLRSLPARLFPRDADPVVLSVFSGEVYGLPVTIAEVEVKDRTSDSSDMLFEGLVLRVGLTAPLPDFLLLDPERSRMLAMTSPGSWFTKKSDIDVGSLKRNPAFSFGTDGPRLWTVPSAKPLEPPLSAVLKILAGPPAEAEINDRLHSATNEGSAVFVALRRPNGPDQIHWTSSSEHDVSHVIRVTFEWLAQPLALPKP